MHAKLAVVLALPCYTGFGYRLNGSSTPGTALSGRHCGLITPTLIAVLVVKCLVVFKGQFPKPGRPPGSLVALDGGHGRLQSSSMPLGGAARGREPWPVVDEGGRRHSAEHAVVACCAAVSLSCPSGRLNFSLSTLRDGQPRS